MSLYLLIEKGAKADQSFSLKFSQNYCNLIRDIFFNILVEISSLYWEHFIVNKTVLVCKMLEGALHIKQTNKGG